MMGSRSLHILSLALNKTEEIQVLKHEQQQKELLGKWSTLFFHGIFILIRFPKQYLEQQVYYTKLDLSSICTVLCFHFVCCLV